MRKNIVAVVLLSIIFANFLLSGFNYAFVILIMIFYLILCLKSEQAIIKLYFFIYLFLVGFADKLDITVSGNQSINFLGIINFILILTFYLKLRNLDQINKKYWNKSLMYPIFLFVFCIILTMPFSKYLLTSFRGINRTLSAISFYLLTYFMIAKSKDAGEKMFNSFMVIFFVLSLYGIFEYITNFNIFAMSPITANVYSGSDVAISSFKRIRTTFIHPGIYAFTILTFLPLNIYYFVKYINKVYVCLFVLLLINLLLTFARIAWIAVFVQIIFSLFLFKSKRLLSFCLLCIPICMAMSGQIMERLTIDSSAEARLPMFLYGLSIFKANFLFGSGLDTFKELSSHKNAAHGDYMRVFAETGIFGGLSYLILLFSYLVFAVKHFKKSDFAKVSFLTLIGFMVFSMTDNGFAYSHIFWGLLGIYNGLIVRGNLGAHPLRIAQHRTSSN